MQQMLQVQQYGCIPAEKFKNPLFGKEIALNKIAPKTRRHKKNLMFSHRGHRGHRVEFARRAPTHSPNTSSPLYLIIRVNSCKFVGQFLGYLPAVWYSEGNWWNFSLKHLAKYEELEKPTANATSKTVPMFFLSNSAPCLSR